MNSIIWMVGAVVIVIFVAGYFGIGCAVGTHQGQVAGEKPADKNAGMLSLGLPPRCGQIFSG